MTYNSILAPEGSVEFLLGNEAVARALYEAGVSVAATYPGTPSSEIGDVLFSLSEEMGIKFEFAVNEKVALEIAAAASAGGLRSVVFMKHVGLNVAMDSFVSLAMAGVNGGLVVFTADDPSMHSSQNEQDNRYLGKFARVPVIEPSNPQELKDFILIAYEISETTGQPVLVRSVTRVSHIRAPVKFGRVTDRKGWQFTRRKSFVLLPENAVSAEKSVTSRLSLALKNPSISSLNTVEGESNTLIITSGSSYNYVGEALDILGLDAKILKIGMSYPLDFGFISEIIKRAENVVFLEEGGPFIEEQVLAQCAIDGLKKKFYGKINGFVPYEYEMDVDRVASILSRIFGIEFHVPEAKSFPPRPPALCPGCPHRATYYVAKLALRQKGIKNAVIPTDIGCYTLGYYEPYAMGDFLLSMGSSIGTANGFSISSGDKVISFIGDSTFFHAGIPALINAYHNRHNFLMVILDNSTTAMTGGQPTPETSDGFRTVDIEKVVRGIGIENVFVIDPYDLRKSLDTFKKALESNDLSVIISKRECALEADRKKTASDIRYFNVNQDKCKLCYNCVRNFSCAAFYIKDKNVFIDPELCDGCGVCAEDLVCPFNAIEVGT
ncbi:MAG: indolepyruvate ferredoxin oxidoreductase subunit alpha [Thermoplasmatales archaeon]